MESAERLRISFLGPLGTYSHQATTEYFGSHHEFLPQPTIADVFTSISSSACQFGLLPIENSSIGPVRETVELLRTTELSLRGMVGLKIGHALLGPKMSIVADGGQRCQRTIERIYSHEQALGQCSQYLKTNYPTANLISVSSTALAATETAKDQNSLAICSSQCVEVYGLDLIDEDIQDAGFSNTTRFVVLSKPNVPLSDEYPISDYLRGIRKDN